jgi:hypothetical protein
MEEVRTIVEDKHIINPRAAALNSIYYEMQPHRINDGEDTDEVWTWKILTMEIQENGSTEIIGTLIV